MFDWIFGSSKGKEEKKTTTQKTLKQQDAWAYDFIKQYLISPLWRNPLLDFMEQNCLIFEDSEENKFEYTKIYKQFVGLCEILLQSIMSDTGISLEILELCLIKGLSSKKDSAIFKQVLLCDNFESFKKIMVAKNKQMEVQAMRQIGGVSAQKQELDQKQLQRLELEKAIAMSLAMQQKMQQKQDEEFEEAIRMSQQMASKVEQKQEKKEEVKTSHLGDLPPLMIKDNKMNKTIQQFRQQETKVIKEIEALKIADKKKEEEQGAEERKKRLMQQRQMIKQKKAGQRKKQLDAFVQNKQGGNTQKVSEQQLERRKKLMQKLKQQLKD